MSLINCSECGKEISDKAKKCPGCGCKIVSEKKSKTKVLIITLITILLLSGIATYFIINKVRENKYMKKYKEIVDIMADTGAKAEDSINTIRQVWSNTIFEENDEKTDKYTKTNGVFNDDFNDSLDNLFTDPDFYSKTLEIRTGVMDVDELFEKMDNPPRKYKKAYEDLEEFYDIFYEFCNLAVSPEGNLTSYSERTRELDSDTAKAFKKVTRNIE